MTINELLANPDLMEVGRKAVEDVLINRRNGRVSLLNCANGLVICEKHGKPSLIIRLTILDAVEIFLKAVEGK